MTNINRGRYSVRLYPCAPDVGVVGTITLNLGTYDLTRDAYGVYWCAYSGAVRTNLVQRKVLQAIKAQTLGNPHTECRASCHSPE